MRHEVKVSVLMPVYNDGRYVRDAVDSILTQTFSDFELIIVNDGSTDETAQLLASYSDPRIRIIVHEANRGRPHARNSALDAARGKYIVWMDADDISLPDRLAKQYAFMEARPHIAVSGGALMVFSRESGVRLAPFDDASIRAGLFWGATIFNPSSCLRREVVVKTGVRFDGALTRAQDYDLWCSLLLDHGLRAANMPDVLLLHRLHKSDPYKAMHDAVLRKNLLRLGMPDKDQSMVVYSYLSHGDDSELRFPVETVVDWMWEVLRHNAVKNIFPQQKLALSMYHRVLNESGKLSLSRAARLKLLWRHLPLPGFFSLLTDLAASKTLRLCRRAICRA